jgi:hypothetical protein
MNCVACMPGFPAGFSNEIGFSRFVGNGHG